MKNLFKYILGEVLHVANSQPPFLWKPEFYRMKDKILTAYGEINGFDVQHIVKECWRCDGTGYESLPVKHLGMVITAQRKCHKCYGSGVYTQFWVHLLRYQLGRRIFHLPTGRFYTDPELNLQRPMIKGYVEHKKYPGHLSAEAFLWLCLFFNFKLFRQSFGHWAISGRTYAPLVICSTFIFLSKHMFQLGYFQRLRSKIVFIRQSYCRHKFPIGNLALDECKKCKISRWQVEPIDIDPIEEFPF